MLVLPPSSGEPIRVSVDRTIAPSPEDYRRFAAEDAAWRRKNARLLTTDEYRARGDWRTPERQALDDRVFALTKRGEHAKGRRVERWSRGSARHDLPIPRLTTNGRTTILRWYREVSR